MHGIRDQNSSCTAVPSNIGHGTKTAFHMFHSLLPFVILLATWPTGSRTIANTDEISLHWYKMIPLSHKQISYQTELSSKRPCSLSLLTLTEFNVDFDITTTQIQIYVYIYLITMIHDTQWYAKERITSRKIFANIKQISDYIKHLFPWQPTVFSSIN